MEKEIRFDLSLGLRVLSESGGGCEVQLTPEHLPQPNDAKEAAEAGSSWTDC